MGKKRTSDDPTSVEQLTDKGAGRIGKALQKTRAGIKKVPGPSTNSATNLLIADIAVRGGSILVRHTVEKGLLRARFDTVKAREIVEGRTLGRILFSSLIARVATRSVPGALLVGTGLVAKTIIDRSMSRRESHRRGLKKLEKQAEN